jgi:hypothetical protein
MRKWFIRAAVVACLVAVAVFIYINRYFIAGFLLADAWGLL